MTVEAAGVWIEYGIRFHNFPQGLIPKRSQIDKDVLAENRIGLPDEELLDADKDFIAGFDYYDLLLQLLAGAYHVNTENLGLYQDSKKRWIISTQVKTLVDTEQCGEIRVAALDGGRIDEYLALGKTQAPHLGEWAEKMQTTAPCLYIHFASG